MIHADLTAQSQALASGALSSVALTTAVLAEIKRRNPQLNAYLCTDAVGALQAAAAADARRRAGQVIGPLDGLTVAFKDNIDVAGLPTTVGMATRRGRIAAQDAVVVSGLRRAGMVVLGKLNMHEAALGATNQNPHYGRCEHPLRPGFTPGGSSGGSACAVAAGLCALALGTDTMGSVRIPAAYCGVVGFKAGWGRVSTRGSVACCPPLDHIGPLLRSARDLALVMPVLFAQDGLENLAAPFVDDSEHDQPVRHVAASDVETLGATPAVAQAYRQALQVLRRSGAALTEIPLAAYDFSRARRAGLLMAEFALLAEHATDWQTQPQNFSPELRKMLRWAEGQHADALAAAQAVVQAAHGEAQRWFAHGEVMLLPTALQQAFSFDDAVPAHQADLTALANMADLPALSLPLPVAAGELPIGLQCIAAAGADRMLLALKLPPEMFT